jgi:hypothetical protein
VADRVGLLRRPAGRDMAALEQFDRLGDALEPAGADRHQLDVVEPPGLVVDGPRDEHLAGPGLGGHPGGQVDSGPDVVAVPIEHRAPMDAEPGRRELWLVADPALERQPAPHCTGCIGEQQHKPVADLLTTWPSDCRTVSRTIAANRSTTWAAARSPIAEVSDVNPDRSMNATAAGTWPVASIVGHSPASSAR